MNGSDSGLRRSRPIQTNTLWCLAIFGGFCLGKQEANLGMLRQRLPRAADAGLGAQSAEPGSGILGQGKSQGSNRMRLGRQEEIAKIVQNPVEGLLRVVSGITAFYGVCCCVRGLHIFSPWSSATSLERVATVACTGGLFIKAINRNLAHWMRDVEETREVLEEFEYDFSEIESIIQQSKQSSTQRMNACMNERMNE